MYLFLTSKGGVPFCGYSATLSIFILFLASGYPNMGALSWHTSVRAEAGLFSSYESLKVGGVIQHDSDE